MAFDLICIEVFVKKTSFDDFRNLFKEYGPRFPGEDGPACGGEADGEPSLDVTGIYK